jgi:hypothetical protein
MAEVGDPSALLEMGEVQAAARPLGIEVVNLDVRRVGEIAPAFEAIKGQVDALYVCGVPVSTPIGPISTPWRSRRGSRQWTAFGEPLKLVP